MKDFVSKYKVKFFRKVFSYGTISKANSINRIFIFWIPMGLWLIPSGYFELKGITMLAFLIPFLFLDAIWVYYYKTSYAEQLKLLRTLYSDLNEHNESEKLRIEKDIDVDTFYLDLWIDPDKKGDDINKKTWQK